MNAQPMRIRAGLALAIVALAVTPGCPILGFSTLVINNALFDNPSLSVGNSTKLTIEASTVPGRTISYQARANRGRIYPEGLTTSKEFTYYAPFTSRAPDANGSPVSGDTVQITVDDGSGQQKLNLPVNLSGSTVAYVANPDANGQGTLALAQTDENGLQVSPAHYLNDSSGKPIRAAQPVISPDGRMIAYVDYMASGPSSAIKTVDASGRYITVVPAGSTGYNMDPTWDQYSHYLAFSSDRSGSFNIWRVPIGEGNTPVQITSARVRVRFPAWNPSLQSDRATLMVVSAQMNTLNDLQGSSPSRAWNLFVINLTSGQFIKQLTNLSDIRDYAFETTWRADGQVIAFTRNGPPVRDPRADSARLQRVYVQDITQNADSGIQLNSKEYSGSVYESGPTWNQSATVVAYLRSTVDPSQPALAQVWRQQINNLVPSPDAPRQWTDFSSGLPALGWNSTELRPNFGLSFNWH